MVPGTKGQKKSKWFFSSRRFLKKTNERILLHYYETSGGLVFVRFLEEIEDTKKTFPNYLTFSDYTDHLEKTFYIDYLGTYVLQTKQYVFLTFHVGF